MHYKVAINNLMEACTVVVSGSFRIKQVMSAADSRFCSNRNVLKLG